MLCDPKSGNPNPWILTEDFAVQSSRQQTAWLLCADCEQRFSKHGERWIFRNGLKQDGTFPLATILDSRIPDVAGPANTTRIYHAAKIPEVNIEAIAYFAASMFWRASVYPWRTDGGYPLKLGPWEEAFRKYLMGEIEFPKDSTLMVIVRERSETDRISYSPVGRRHGTMHIHKFPMPGFAFTLSVSKHLDDWCHNLCFIRGAGNPLIITDTIEEGLISDSRRILVASLDKATKEREAKRQQS
jgi:hypothetical protein